MQNDKVKSKVKIQNSNYFCVFLFYGGTARMGNTAMIRYTAARRVWVDTNFQRQGARDKRRGYLVYSIQYTGGVRKIMSNVK